MGFTGYKLGNWAFFFLFLFFETHSIKGGKKGNREQHRATAAQMLRTSHFLQYSILHPVLCPKMNVFYYVVVFHDCKHRIRPRRSIRFFRTRKSSIFLVYYYYPQPRHRTQVPLVWGRLGDPVRCTCVFSLKNNVSDVYILEVVKFSRHFEQEFLIGQGPRGQSKNLKKYYF